MKGRSGNLRWRVIVGALMVVAALTVLLLAAIAAFMRREANEDPALQASVLAAGATHTCFLDGGEIMCWGANDSGQLGNGIISPDARNSTPVRVVGLGAVPVAAVAASRHSCALLQGGGVECWGANFLGELGDGDVGGIRSTPVDVVGLEEGVAALATTFWHTCALTRSGGVKCWGDNGYGQLGDGTMEPSDRPVPVAGLEGGVAGIAAAQGHSCALLSSGEVRCWGYNAAGQLGDGTTEERHEPVKVRGLPENVTTIAAGYLNTCALTRSGDVWCWGLVHRREFQPGYTETEQFSATPVRIDGLRDVVAIDSGAYHSCALNSAGGVQCWGTDQDGQIGDGEFEIPPPTGSTPANVAGLAGGVRALDVGAEHTCAVVGEGTVKCWGVGYGWVPKDVEFLTDDVSENPED